MHNSGSAFIYSFAALSLLAMAVLLCGCDSQLTPDQVAAIEEVEAAKAASLRELQPLENSFDRCIDASLAALNRCIDARQVERCAARCKPKFKQGSKKQVELERCVDLCLDDEEERRLLFGICERKGDDQSVCARQFYKAVTKLSTADYDRALRVCIEKGVPSDYCTGKRRYK